MELLSNATVKNDAKPGRWPVSYQCGPRKVTGYIRLIDKRSPEPYAAIGIRDRRIEPGQKVMVDANCRDPEFTSSKVISTVLTVPDLRREKGAPADSLLTALGRVHKNARPGTHSLSFTCAGKQVTGEFTVERPAPRSAQVPVKPKGAPETGA